MADTFGIKLTLGTDTVVPMTPGTTSTVTVVYGTAINALSVKIEAQNATGTATIKADGNSPPSTSRSSAFTFDFSAGQLNITAVDSADSTVTLSYALKVVVAAETVAKPAQIYKVGWYSARAIEDDFDSFDNSTGAVEVEVGPFKPKYVVNINITGGAFTSYFDLATNKLYVFKGTSRATKADLADSRYQLLIME